MKLGVIVNPKAGNGPKVELIRRVVQKLKPDEIITGQDDLGERYFQNPEVVEIERTHDRDDTIRLVKILDRKADVIAVFGGDGTASDAASAFPKKPLLCIPMGTTNVSPIMCDVDFKDLRVTEFDALYVEEYNRIAFNDVVSGPTILATVNGKIVELDALAFMKGETVKGNPGKFYGRVTEGERVIEGIYGNIFVSMLDKRYLGKGISGGASISAFVGFKCLVACLSHTVVMGSMTKDSLKNLEPIKTETLSFDDKIKLYADTVISADGNPFTYKEEVEIKYMEGAIKVLKDDQVFR